MSDERKDVRERKSPLRPERDEARRTEQPAAEGQDPRASDSPVRDAEDEAWRRDRRPAGYPAETPDDLGTAPQAILGGEGASLRQEWEAIQAGFVDEPRRAVERADALVARAAQRLAEAFAQERARLEQQWSRGDEVSTEDLRVSLRRYRAFFDRLLSI